MQLVGEIRRACMSEMDENLPTAPQRMGMAVVGQGVHEVEVPEVVWASIEVEVR